MQGVTVDKQRLSCLASSQDHYQHRILGSPHCWILLEGQNFLTMILYPDFVSKPFSGSTYTAYLPMNFWSRMLYLNWQHEVAALRERGVKIASDLHTPKL